MQLRSLGGVRLLAFRPLIAVVPDYTLLVKVR